MRQRFRVVPSGRQVMPMWGTTVTPGRRARGLAPLQGRRVGAEHPATGMGFSLKPPKWIRKAQPGKILKKIALPAAAIGAALLIPGVAPAVGGAIAATGRSVTKIPGLIGKLFKPAIVQKLVQAPFGPPVVTSATTPSVAMRALNAVTSAAPSALSVFDTGPAPPISGGGGGSGSMMPGGSPETAVPSGGGGVTSEPAGAPVAAADGMGWIMPVAIGGAVLLGVMAMNGRKKAA